MTEIQKQQRREAMDRFRKTPKGMAYYKKYRATHKVEDKKRYEDYKAAGLIGKWRRAYKQTLLGRYHTYKHGAKIRWIKFCLTLKQFSSLWQKPCSYCGAEISTIGIDRINNAKGYVKGNVTPCCRRCNTMKMDMDRDEFLRVCTLIAKRQEVS